MAENRLEGLEKTFLDEIFGEVRIADAFASKSDEGRQVFQDWFLNLIHNEKIGPPLQDGNLTVLMNFQCNERGR